MTTHKRTILITGSTDGVGRCLALRLGASDAHVLIHGRDAGRGEEVVSEIRRLGGSGSFYRVDLSSLAAVGDFAATIRREHDQLDVLVNNAGIGVGRGQRELSLDGYELRFAVNYLATFLLTRLLLPNLGRTRLSRIVNVSSAGQQRWTFRM